MWIAPADSVEADGGLLAYDGLNHVVIGPEMIDCHRAYSYYRHGGCTMTFSHVHDYYPSLPTPPPPTFFLSRRA
jgi:hypothetical protein